MRLVEGACGQRLEGGMSRNMARTLGSLSRCLEGWAGAGIRRRELTVGVDSFECVLGDSPHPEGTREPWKVSE